MTPSASKLAANQANAQLSTGPRSETGKSRSSQNARTHGLTAKHLKISPEDQPAFDSFNQALQHELAPVGVLETALYDRILRAHWTLRIIDTLEADLLSACDPFNSDHTTALNRFSLYRSRTETGLSKATTELRNLQEERLLRDSALDNPHDYTPIVRIASVQKSWTTFNRRTKRTQLENPSCTPPPSVLS